MRTAFLAIVLSAGSLLVGCSGKCGEGEECRQQENLRQQEESPKQVSNASVCNSYTLGSSKRDCGDYAAAQPTGDCKLAHHTVCDNWYKGKQPVEVHWIKPMREGESLSMGSLTMNQNILVYGQLMESG